MNGQEFIVKVHVVLRATSHESAEAKVADALRGFVRSIPHAGNAYVVDVRGENDDEDGEA